MKFLKLSVLISTSLYSTIGNSANWNICDGSIVKVGTTDRKWCASTVSYPASGAFRSTLGTVFSRWNTVQAKSLGVFDTTACTFSTSNSDGLSSTWFTSSMPTGFTTNPAVALTRTFPSPLCNRISESDLIFNSATGFVWNAGEDMMVTPFSTYTTLPFYSVAMHEIGHGIGLNHENCWLNLMGNDRQNVTFIGTTTDYQPGEDATVGAQIIYGGTGSGADVGVSIFVYSSAATGTSDYSQSPEGVVTTTAGGAITSNVNTVTPGPKRRYTVTRGNSYRFPITIENRGDTSPGVSNIDGRVSTDIYISTSDTYAGGWSTTQTGDQPNSTYLDVTIPLSAPTGTAYVGFTIAPASTSDTNYWNNSTYYAVTVN